MLALGQAGDLGIWLGAARARQTGLGAGAGSRWAVEPPPPLWIEPVKNLGVTDGICNETEATADAQVER